jgi:hypothetical protein
LVQANVAGSGVPLPIRHSVAIHGAPTDSLGDPSNSYLADSVKAVRINIRVSNGRTGAALRTRDVSTITSLPNNGLVQVKTCGTNPILAGVITRTQPLGPNTPVRLQWNASADETAGESDVTQYNIYRRRTGDPAPGDAVGTVVPAAQPTYQWQDGTTFVTGQSYIWSVGAQDCSPAESTLLETAGFVPSP